MHDLAARLNASAQIPKDFLRMAERDRGFATAHGLPKREDVANMHRIIGEGPGWVDRLRTAYARREYLPAAMLGALGLGSMSRGGGERSG